MFIALNHIDVFVNVPIITARDDLEFPNQPGYSRLFTSFVQNSRLTTSH